MGKRGPAKGTPKPEGAGRKKGTPNKDTRTLEEKAKLLGCDPFEILCRFAMGDWQGLGYPDRQRVVAISEDGVPIMEDYIKPELRAKCAQEASQYLYPKRKALELSSNENEGFKIVIADYTVEKK